MTKAVNLAQYGNVSPSWRNRIINGSMGIWQRGTSFAAVAAGAYLADRFFWNNGGGTTGAATVSRSTDVPSGSGFPYSLLATVTTAQASVGAGNFTNFCQRIEGFNCYDLAYGTASAQSFTASFWIKSNLTGTFTGSFSQNGASPYVRTYPYSFTIAAANTWQQITITVPGDTAGTIPYSSSTGLTWDIAYMPLGSNFQTGTINAWNANSTGLQYSPSGVTPVNLFATVGNTLQITGLQLEVGTSATNFDYRPYGTELALCQRYYQTSSAYYAFANNTTTVTISTVFPVAMRTGPTMSIYSSILRLSDNSADYTSSGAFSSVSAYSSGVRFSQAGYSGLTAGKFYIGYGDLLAANAEL